METIIGKNMPDYEFMKANGRLNHKVNFKGFLGKAVLYIQPGPVPPQEKTPAGWDTIPGTAGCKEESCEFEKLITHFAYKGNIVFGLSSQKSVAREQFRRVYDITHHLVSDPNLILAKHLGLETFEHLGKKYYKRITLILREGVIVDTVDNITTPGDNPKKVLDRL